MKWKKKKGNCESAFIRNVVHDFEAQQFSKNNKLKQKWRKTKFLNETHVEKFDNDGQQRQQKTQKHRAENEENKTLIIFIL